MRILALLIVSVILLSSCRDRRYKFDNDIDLTFNSGIPKSNMALYFPLCLYIDSLKFDKWKVEADTTGDVYVSGILYRLHEPILYNMYLDKEIYRLTFLRSFDSNIIIRLEKNKDSVRMISKSIYEHIANPIRYIHGSPVIDSISIDSTTEIKTMKFWNDFEHLVSTNLNLMPSTVAMDFGPDGNISILEGHSINGYTFIKRSSYSKDLSRFERVCDSLINHSNLKIK